MQCEGVAWDPWGDERIWLAFENGSIGEIDSSKGLGLTFNQKVSAKSITSQSANPHHKGVLSATGQDGSVRLFDVNDRDEDNNPKKIYDKITRGGKLYCGNFCQDTPNLYACGSNSGDVVLMDFKNIDGICDTFKTAEEIENDKKAALTIEKKDEIISEK